jgi:hypothetical protein
MMYHFLLISPAGFQGVLIAYPHIFLIFFLTGFLEKLFNTLISKMDSIQRECYKYLAYGMISSCNCTSVPSLPLPPLTTAPRDGCFVHVHGICTTCIYAYQRSMRKSRVHFAIPLSLLYYSQLENQITTIVESGLFLLCPRLAVAERGVNQRGGGS